MADELEICAAAFFRIKGKDVVTEQEFKMGIALDLKWTSVKEADALLKTLISKQILQKNNGYIKPAVDLTTVQVPIAYRPSEDLKKSLSGTIKTTSAPKPVTKPVSDAPKDLFLELMEFAEQNGIPKGKFVSESNAIRKKLGVETCIAAMVLLKDNGIDVEKWMDRAYAQILGK